MNARRNPWWRCYAEMVDDDKLKLLAPSDRWWFVGVCCLKCKQVLDSGAPHLDRRVAVSLGLTSEEAAEAKRRMMEVGLIDEDWQPRAWVKRQFESDTSGAARTQKYRAKNTMKRHSDNGVTSRVTKCDILDTETESDTETDTPRLRRGVQRGTARARPSKRLPRNWQPSTDLLAWAATEAPQVDFAHALATIRDHEFKNPHTDWDAVVRNWLRRDQSQAEERGHLRGASNGSQQPLFRDDDDSLDGVVL